MLFRFGDFELDTTRVELRSGGDAVPVEPQVFALLALLVENRERLVSRDEIIEKVWDGRVVSEAAVASRIKSARQALGDDGKAQRCIRTIHGQGLAIRGRGQGCAGCATLGYAPSAAHRRDFAAVNRRSAIPPHR